MSFAIIACGSKFSTKKICKIADHFSITYLIHSLTAYNSENIENAIVNQQPSGIIIAGSQDHIYHPKARSFKKSFSEFIIKTQTPTLGICYGHQLIASLLGGKIAKNPQGIEFGKKQIQTKISTFPLFKGISLPFRGFMAHFDIITQLPDCLENFASTNKTEICAIQFKQNEEYVPIFGIQFHPEFSEPQIAHAIFHNFFNC
jgi:GMP synthase (glutamine-hydrolysing)